MSSLEVQSRALRQGAGILQKFPRALLAVRGADRSQFLHNVLTHDIKGLLLGQGRHACLLDRLGKVQALFLVHAHADQILLEMDPSHLEPATKGLQKYRIAEAVELTDATSHHRIIPLHGPQAQRVLEKAWPALQLPVAPLSHCGGPADSGIQWICRWDLLKVPGFHLWVEPSQEEEIRSTLMGTDPSLKIQSITEEGFECLRIESGVPWPGHEIDEDVIFNELGTEEWASYTKGCFVGQEIVARIKYRAHPPRLLRGFLLEGSQIPPKTSPIEQGSKTVGVITSACFSPALNRVVALGFLAFGNEGGNLLVRTPGGPIHATVAPLPFIS